MRFDDLRDERALTLHLWTASVYALGRICALALSKVLYDPADVFHLNSLSARIAQIEDPREHLCALLFFVFQLAEFLVHRAELRSVDRAGVRRIKNTVLGIDGGQMAKEQLPILARQAKVEMFWTSKPCGVLRTVRILQNRRARFALYRDKVTPSIFLDAPYLLLFQNELSELGLFPACFALGRALVAEHRIRTGTFEQAHFELALFEVLLLLESGDAFLARFERGSRGVEKRDRWRRAVRGRWK